jgi:hypothetical protein
VVDWLKELEGGGERPSQLPAKRSVGPKSAAVRPGARQHRHVVVTWPSLLAVSAAFLGAVIVVSYVYFS